MKVDRRVLARTLTTALETAIHGQAPVAARYVSRVRDRHPEDSPSELVKRLEHHYVRAVTAGGAGAGAAATVPAIGTAPALAVNVAEVGWFLESTVLYILAVADVHQLHINDPERRRALVLTVLVGESLSGGVAKAAGRTGPHLARKVVTKIPMSAVRALNSVLGRNFVTKYGTKQGLLVLGRQLPFGLGAVIGGGGNAAVGYMTIRAARLAFGPPPESWPSSGSPEEPTEPGAAASAA